MSAYRLVSLVITALSSWTFVYNCVRNDHNPVMHTFLALVMSGIGLAVFGAGIWWQRPWLKWSQVGLMLTVSLMTVALNDVPWVGLFFLFVSVVTAYAYDLFDDLPVLKLSILTAVLFLIFVAIYPDGVKSLLTFLGFIASSTLVGYILWDKMRRLRQVAKEASAIAHEAIDLVKKEGENGPERKLGG